MWHGIFRLNDQPMSRLDIGSFSVDAFSGDGKHRNKKGSMCMKDEGPIPNGLYYIVDRESGGLFGKLRDIRGGKSDWFALYANDGMLNDTLEDSMFCHNVERGLFRLHPKGMLGISKGCIVIEKKTDFLSLRHFLLTYRHKIPGTEIYTYGTIQVI